MINLQFFILTVPSMKIAQISQRTPVLIAIELDQDIFHGNPNTASATFCVF